MDDAQHGTRQGQAELRPIRPAAFTLVELLVVIAIIMLLASIVMPSLAQARDMAKSSSCLSNMHNIGTALLMYECDSGGYFPTSYNYIDGAGSGNGYYHWTAALTPGEYEHSITSGKYPRKAKQFVCPSQSYGGWAPTNFTTARIGNPPAGQVSQDASNTKDDRQAPRLSYVANEIVMPRKKFSGAYDVANPPGTSNLCLVQSEEIAGHDSTILLGEFSSSSNCIWGSSVGGGAAYKSHRPTNGVKSSQADGVFDGEGYARGTQVWKLTYDEAMTAIDAVLADKGAASTSHHISYVNPNAHRTGSNYTFVDGHAEKFTLKETLDPGNYMWGRKVYSAVDKPEIQDNP